LKPTLSESAAVQTSPPFACCRIAGIASGSEKACTMLIERVGEFDGPEWAAEHV
jgi:hypothetical protein